MKTFVLAMIMAYQKYISPKKGFSCAYRLRYGGSGCSGVGLRLIRRYGVFSGCFLLRKRLARCKFAANEIRQIVIQRQNGFAVSQRGDCIPIDCCIPDIGECGTLTEQSELGSKCETLFDVAECGCDCSDWLGQNQSEKPKKHRQDIRDSDSTYY